MIFDVSTRHLGTLHLFFATHHLSLSNFVTHHLSLTTFTHTIFHTKLCHIHHFLRRTPSFTYHFVTHNSSHTTCFTSRSSTTSFVFPSLPVPATTHYWKKLTCGVIRSFNVLLHAQLRSIELFRLVDASPCGSLVCCSAWGGMLLS